MYYLIENAYVGINADQYFDADTLEISTAPADTSAVYNGWSARDHGEYATLDAARAAIAEKFGDVRKVLDCEILDPDADVIETYKVGKYAPMSSRETAEWLDSGAELEITAETTDARIAELVDEYEDVANEQGLTLDSDAADILKERRDELKAV